MKKGLTKQLPQALPISSASVDQRIAKEGVLSLKFTGTTRQEVKEEQPHKDSPASIIVSDYASLAAHVRAAHSVPPVRQDYKAPPQGQRLIMVDGAFIKPPPAKATIKPPPAATQVKVDQAAPHKPPQLN